MKYEVFKELVPKELFSSVVIIANQAEYELKNESELDSFIAMLKDVIENGVDCGFNGFIYYKETEEFFDKNKHIILDYINNVDFLSNLSQEQLQEYLLDSIYDGAMIKNDLCWAFVECIANDVLNCLNEN